MINLKIMTPDHGVCLNQEVEYVDVNTIDGHIGLQHGITSMLATLKNSHCKIKITQKSELEIILCGGILFVDKNDGIKIFTKNFAFLSDLNKEKIENNVKSLEIKIKNLTHDHKDYVETLDELMRNKDLLEAINTK